jgi:iron complex outermembrane receptor protein
MQHLYKKRSTALTKAVSQACIALVVATAAPVVMAQDDSIEQVTITGSRITRPGLTSPTPVTAIERDELETLGPATLMDGLDALPQFMGSATLNDTENLQGGGYLGSGGQSHLNMRGVGSNRTLVLVNNRRQPSTSRTGGFDISLLPQVLISRTEVVTGGASAAYGSDAIAGVTNFILNENFDGFEAVVQGGITEIGDADNMRLSLGAGTEVGDKGHFVIGVEAFKTAEIPNMHKRDWYRDWCNLDMGVNAQPRRVLAEDCHSRTQTYGGFVASGPLVGTMFLDDGSPAMFQQGTQLDSAALAGLPRNTIAGNQSGGDGAQFARDQMKRASQERASIFLNYKHDFSESLRGSVSALYGNSYVDNQKVGYMLFSQWAPTIYSGNAYLPASVQQAMDAGNVQSFTLHKRVLPSDPLHNGRAPLTTDIFTFSTSLEGDLDNGWNWNWYYQFGESNRDVEMYGFRVDRLYRAADAVRHPVTGAIVCESTLRFPDDGCKPINLFGVGNASPEALAYVQDKMFTDTRITQHSTEFVLSGEVFEGFGAGPVFMAAGGNWRSDSIDQISGDALNSPLPDDGFGPVTAYDDQGNLIYRGLPSLYERTGAIIDRVGAASFNGSVDVWEAFAETIIPLISDKQYIDMLESSFAIRHTDYEQSGEVLSWKGGFTWQVNDELRLRLTRSRDMRAGNLSEMFDTTQLYAFMNDPWNPQADTYTVKQISGGNPGVKPEKADTLTYGFVYQPEWLSGAAFTMDYYDIRIKDSISTIGAQNIVDYCYEQNLFCDQIAFGNGGTGNPGDMIEAVNNTTLNVGEARTRGIDYELSYRTPVSWFNRADNLSVRLIASRLIESTITPFDSPKTSRLGSGDLQRLNATFVASYLAGPASLSWTTRWVSDGVQSVAWTTGIDVDNNRIPSHHVSNVRLNWNLENVGNGDTNVYLSINNVFDRNPGDLRGFSGIYDILGRNYTLGMRYKL